MNSGISEEDRMMFESTSNNKGRVRSGFDWPISIIGILRLTSLIHIKSVDIWRAGSDAGLFKELCMWWPGGAWVAVGEWSRWQRLDVGVLT